MNDEHLNEAERDATYRLDGLNDAAQAPAGGLARNVGLPVATQAHSVPVIINGRPRELATADASFEDIVRLAFPNLPVGAQRTFTVTYRRGDAQRPEGSLVANQATRLAPGAVINVSATDKS